MPRESLPTGPESVLSVGALSEMLPDGLVVIGPDRVVHFANSEALRILRCRRESLVGRPLVEALPLLDTSGRDWWSEADPWGGLSSLTGHREKLLVAPGGRQLLITARYIRLERGGPIQRILLGLRDAAARQRAERATANVLTTVAHELRAPLTSVTGFTASLLRRWDRFTDEQKRLMIETIQSDAIRLSRLITELLDISRLDSDRLSLRLGPVDIQDLLRRHVVRDKLGRPTDEIVLELGPAAREKGLPELWADADRLEQVFFNLVENARRHGSGRVTVTIERDGDDAVARSDQDGHPDRRQGQNGHPRQDGRAAQEGHAREPGVLIYVDDEGPGVPEEDRHKVFDRFWRGDSAVTTGLGLFVVRGLVEAHGGSVAVGSAVGGGARFIVRLPSRMPGWIPS